MRLRLVGYSGERPPVPGTTPVDPVDPEPTPDPVPDPDDIPQPIVLVLANGDEFKKADYLALGYNRFDVMCIGASGGRGGGYTQTYEDGDEYFRGGGPGGGGTHRIKGRLALLPAICPIVVGQAGADGPFDNNGNIPNTDWAAVVDGGDGGATSFGGTICRASGGTGGKAYLNNAGGYRGAPAGRTGVGGSGGLGNTLVAGGGAGGGAPAFGVQGVGSAGADGTWNGTIGKGGGGGSAGAFRNHGKPLQDGNPWRAALGNLRAGAAKGGRGTYLAADQSVSGPGGNPGIVGFTYVFATATADPANPFIYEDRYGEFAVISGAGGGASAFPLNGLTTQYGSKVDGNPGHGAVIIRLSYAIV